MQDVVNSAIAPHSDRPDRFVIDGASIPLTSQQALGLSLAIHELSTNSVKYGALSSDQGQVRLDWSVGHDGRFKFRWAEQGGPRVRPPEGRGFGSQLTTQVVPTYFDGEGNTEFHPEGLVYALTGQLTGAERE